ncbi:MAG: hypothetical protein JST22_11385 [Bacteroidetes bacterium]|nr:hypothetical protein [Bacteroidota bacterium]
MKLFPVYRERCIRLCILLVFGLAPCALHARTMTLELFACSIDVPDSNWTAEEHLSIDTAKRSIMILSMERMRPAATISIGMGFANLSSDVSPEVIRGYARTLQRHHEVVIDYGPDTIGGRPVFHTVSTRASADSEGGKERVYRTLILMEGYCYIVTTVMRGNNHPEWDADIRRVIGTLRISDERTTTIDRFRESMGIARYDGAYTLYKVIKLAAGVFVAAGFLFIIVWMYLRRKRHRKILNQQSGEEQSLLP